MRVRDTLSSGEAENLCRALCPAAVAVLGIPVLGDTAVLAAYPLEFLLEPLVDTDFLLAFDVFQHLGVMRNTVIVEPRNQVAGEVRAVGAPCNPFFFRGALLYLAVATVRADWAVTKAALAGDFFNRYIPAFREVIEKVVKVLAFIVMPGTVQGTGPAVKAADRTQVFTFHNILPPSSVEPLTG